MSLVVLGTREGASRVASHLALPLVKSLKDAHGILVISPREVKNNAPMFDNLPEVIAKFDIVALVAWRMSGMELRNLCELDIRDIPVFVGLPDRDEFERFAEGGEPPPHTIDRTFLIQEGREEFARRDRLAGIEVPEVASAAGIVSPERVSEALVGHDERGLTVVQALRRAGLSWHEIDRLSYAARGIPYAPISWDEVDFDELHRVGFAIAKECLFCPVRRDDGLIIAMARPDNIDDRMSVERIWPDKHFSIQATPSENLLSILSRAHDQLAASSSVEVAESFAGAFDDEVEEDVAAAAEEVGGPVVKIVETILNLGVGRRASDIHIESTPSGVRVRYRIDGVLDERSTTSYPAKLAPYIIARLKIIARLNGTEYRLPQDGRLTWEYNGKHIDVRVATIPAVIRGEYREKAVLRLFDGSDTVPSLSDLGMSPNLQEGLERLMRRQNGVVLIAGPTGSGKSTTMYALYGLLPSGVAAYSIEDPVERNIPNVAQVPVLRSERTNLTFAAALRAFLRADPDVIGVGEIRDGETAETALGAAITGHLVVSSIHTNSAAATPARLIEMGVEPFLAAEGLRGVLSQRLIRRLCGDCRRPADPPEGLDLPGSTQVYEAVGCARCGGSGYLGRLAIGELLIVDGAIRDAIIHRASTDEIFELAVKGGMVPIWSDGIKHLAAGETSYAELLRVVSQ